MDKELEFSGQAFSKMLMHAMKYPHAICNGLLLAPKSRDDSGVGDINETKISDAIPISHASHYLTPNIEIAFNAINNYAKEQSLIVAGYYQTNEVDNFSQKIADKICESFPNAVLCCINFEKSSYLEPYQMVDGKWRCKSSDAFSIENELKMLVDQVLYSKEKLYRQIIDFDEHFNNIKLDWTNVQISERIDNIIANAC